MKNDLPKDPAERNRVILSIFGTLDIRQIDVLGGADLLTSKLAIILTLNEGRCRCRLYFCTSRA